MKSTFQKLADKIKNDLEIEAINFVRHYPGHHQRSGGAFVWSAGGKNRICSIGSSFSATELLKSKSLILGDFGNEIYPCEIENDDIIK